MKTRYEFFEYWMERDALMASCVACDIAQGKARNVVALAWLAEVRLLRPELTMCVEKAELESNYRPLRHALRAALRRAGRSWGQVYGGC